MAWRRGKERRRGVRAEHARRGGGAGVRDPASSVRSGKARLGWAWPGWLGRPSRRNFFPFFKIFFHTNKRIIIKIYYIGI